MIIWLDKEFTSTLWAYLPPPSNTASYNPDNLTDDELPDWMEDAESEFTDKLDQDHNGLLDYKEIKEWLAPSEEVFFKEEAQHLLSHVDKDKVTDWMKQYM